jgi:hypothetical protein
MVRPCTTTRSLSGIQCHRATIRRCESEGDSTLSSDEKELGLQRRPPDVLAERLAPEQRPLSLSLSIGYLDIKYKIISFA